MSERGKTEPNKVSWFGPSLMLKHLNQTGTIRASKHQVPFSENNRHICILKQCHHTVVQRHCTAMPSLDTPAWTMPTSLAARGSMMDSVKSLQMCIGNQTKPLPVLRTLETHAGKGKHRGFLECLQTILAKVVVKIHIPVDSID